MPLDDPSLSFASDLIAHWTEIRGSGLVPFDIRVDPTKMIRSVPFITIAKISNPEVSQLMELGLHRRYGRDITRANWFELLAPQHRESVKEVTRLLLSVPCGLYYKLRVSSDDQTVSEGETLVLPLRSISSESPDMAIISHGRHLLQARCRPRCFRPPPGDPAVPVLRRCRCGHSRRTPFRYRRGLKGHRNVGAGLRTRERSSLPRRLRLPTQSQRGPPGAGHLAGGGGRGADGAGVLGFHRARSCCITPEEKSPAQPSRVYFIIVLWRRSLA